jgi:hypothetical protein
MYSGKTRTGQFIPTNWEKYIGESQIIEYRSSWELKALQFFDNNPNVLRWSYENIHIPYIKPLPNGNMKRAIYIPDAYVEYVNRNKELKKELLEIKPKKQTVRSRTRNVTRKMNEDYVFAVNMAKWEAAERWCKHRGITFRIITEVSIFGA